MNQNKRNPGQIAFLQAVKNFFHKLRQNPDIYPIRYYKKTHRYRKTFKSQLYK